MLPGHALTIYVIAGDDPRPDVPLRNRPADNWRVPLSIADSLGHSEDARAAAVALSKDRPDEDAGVVLLTDIRGVFGKLDTDRIKSEELVKESPRPQRLLAGLARRSARPQADPRRRCAVAASIWDQVEIDMARAPRRRQQQSQGLHPRPVRGRVALLLRIRHSGTPTKKHTVSRKLTSVFVPAGTLVGATLNARSALFTGTPELRPSSRRLGWMLASAVVC
jgi:Protein of unknown function (DUF3631)